MEVHMLRARRAAVLLLLTAIVVIGGCYFPTEPTQAPTPTLKVSWCKPDTVLGGPEAKPVTMQYTANGPAGQIFGHYANGDSVLINHVDDLVASSNGEWTPGKLNPGEIGTGISYAGNGFWIFKSPKS